MTTLMPLSSWTIVLSLAALSVMGLVSLWNCPDVTERIGEHWLFKRQAVYLCLGLSGFSLVLMWAPTLAWAVEKFAANVKWLLVITGIGLCLAGVVSISNMAAEASRDEVEVMMRQRAESGCREAIRGAHCFSSTDDTQKYLLPGSYSENMPAACALRFGHWFNVLSLLLWVAFACATVCCFRKVSRAGKKMFVAVVGSTILAMAVHGYGMCFGIFPFTLYGCVPLVSYSGGLMIVVWLTAGILVSLSGGAVAKPGSDGVPSPSAATVGDGTPPLPGCRGFAP